jgi:hypothetical protein
MIIKQEVLTSESDDTDSDYADFLRTYDLEKESSDSENYIVLFDSASSAGLLETKESQERRVRGKV